MADKTYKKADEVLLKALTSEPLNEDILYIRLIGAIELKKNNLAKEIDDTEEYWSIPLMAQWIKNNYQQDIPHTTILYHLNKLGYSYTTSRPHPYKGDPLLQEEFKKKALLNWSKN